MAGLLESLHATVDELLAVDVVALADAAVVESLLELERAARRLPAVRHGLVYEVDSRGIPADRQVRSTPVYLQMVLNVTPAEGAGWVYQAREQHHRRSLTTGEPLDPVLPHVAAAVRTGALSPGQTQVISAAMRQVPAAVPHERRLAVEADLVTHAAQFDPRPLQRLAQRALDCLDPDGKPTPEEVQARTGLHFGRLRRDGLTPFKGLADPETRAALEAALAPLAQPAHSEHEPDTRTRPQRLIAALRDLALRALANGSLPTLAGMPATLLLTATLEQLEARTGLVSVLNGGTIPVADVIRMAGMSLLVPIVFTSAGRILHCGQEQRLATLPIRHATAAQDRGCVIPGCETPITGCQLHHLDPYAQGGHTDVDNPAWLCPYHHHRINNWHLQRTNGRVWCTPPPWLDPTATPKINTYHHLNDQPTTDLFTNTNQWPPPPAAAAAEQRTTHPSPASQRGPRKPPHPRPGRSSGTSSDRASPRNITDDEDTGDRTRPTDDQPGQTGDHLGDSSTTGRPGGDLFQPHF